MTDAAMTADGPDRRHTDVALLNAVNQLSRQVQDVRDRQEQQLAVAIRLQEHATIERVDAMWDTIGEWKTAWTTLKTVLRTVQHFLTWGCATTLAIFGLGLTAYHFLNP